MWRMCSHQLNMREVVGEALFLKMCRLSLLDFTEHESIYESQLATPEVRKRLGISHFNINVCSEIM